MIGKTIELHCYGFDYVLVVRKVNEEGIFADYPDGRWAGLFRLDAIKKLEVIS